jgi:two-component system response regulator AtoC
MMYERCVNTGAIQRRYPKVRFRVVKKNLIGCPQRLEREPVGVRGILFLDAFQIGKSLRPTDFIAFLQVDLRPYRWSAGEIAGPMPAWPITCKKQGVLPSERGKSLVQLGTLRDPPDLPPMEILFGRTHGMAMARQKLERVAESTVPVLFQGESGTGKELFARVLHLRSQRARRPLVKVTCPAIPSSLIETELFGYEKGSFTGANGSKPGRVEGADQGTLFLDEIGSLDISVQVKLLQLLQEGIFFRVGGQEPRKIDMRLISAANYSLQQQVQEGSFRLDFLFRINAVTIEVLPLRQRIIDLPALLDHFLALYSRTFRRNTSPFSRDMLRLMHNYDWPGNIRQLENIVRSYVLIGSEEELAAELVATTCHLLSTEIDLASPVCLKQITKSATQNLESQIILRVLQANGWNRQKTAKWLKISYRSLLYKLRDLGLQSPRTQPTVRSITASLPNSPGIPFDQRESCTIGGDNPG